MIPELGHFALVLALVIATAQATIPLVGAQRNSASAMALAKSAALGQLVFIGAAFLALTYCFVMSDFSVMTVAANSHSNMPLVYKIAGVWGNHEGSMLLWVLILALFGASVALFGTNLPPQLAARVLAVQGMIGVGFLAFILFTSNPFLRLDPAPPNGNSLNPLLQDPGLASHPPFLYLGYVGFSMAFSFAVAALIEGKVDPAWARWVRPWTLAAWCFLTMGIMLGSAWAYYELGWGGWWYWDPVENVSLMPWLSGTALLHSAIVVEKRDALKRWTILLAILTFTLSLIGTFLVRSGVITSVHAFATDPSRGVFILALLLATSGGALTLYAIRAPSLKIGNLFAPVSREGSLILNNVILVAITATILLGTFYPLFVAATSDDRVSVGPPFYNLFFVPTMIVLMIVMAIGPFLSWKRADLKSVLFRMQVSALAAIAAAGTALWLSWGKGSWAFVAVGAGVWLLAASLHNLGHRLDVRSLSLESIWHRAKGLPRASYGLAVAHAGFAVVALGIAGVAGWSAELVTQLNVGERATLGGYTIELESVTKANGANYEAIVGHFNLISGNTTIAQMNGERRFYPDSNDQTTEAAIRVRPWGNIYLALGEQSNDGRWSVRGYVHPLIAWIWFGAVIMVCGGLLSLSDRRLRVGAPKRAATAARPALAGQEA